MRKEVEKMSQYIHFFVRIGDKFAPIACYSRSTNVFEAFQHYVPYEQIAPLTSKKIEAAREEVTDRIIFYESTIREWKDKLQLLREITTAKEKAFDEFLEKYDEIIETIREYEETVEEWEYVQNFCTFLDNAILEAEELQEEGRCEGDPLNYIYSGIECGSSVTSEDIKK